MTRFRDWLAKGVNPLSRIDKPALKERCPRCHKKAGYTACLLCAPHLVSASLVGSNLRYLIELRESKLQDKQQLLNAVQIRKLELSKNKIFDVSSTLTIHELSAAGTYLP